MRSGVRFFLAEGNGEEQLRRGHLLLLRGLPLVAVGPHHRSKMADLEWYSYLPLSFFLVLGKERRVFCDEVLSSGDLYSSFFLGCSMLKRWDFCDLVS